MNPLLPLEILVPLFFLLMIGVWLVAWKSLQHCPSRVRPWILLLRIAGVALIGLILFNPGRWVTPDTLKDVPLAILLDRSASMNTQDVDGESRWRASIDIARRALEPLASSQAFDVYTFDSKVRVAPGDWDDFPPSGEEAKSSTDLIQAGHEILNRFQGRAHSLRGMVILSDGRQVVDTGPEDLISRARAEDVPIWTVCLGGEVKRRDVSVRARQTRYITFTNQSLRIGAIVENNYLHPIEPEVRLLDENGEQVHSVAVQVPVGAERSVDFDVKLPSSGEREWKIVVDPLDEENVVANNQSMFHITVLDRKIGVLILEGSPHWESKFLIQLLRQQPHMSVTTIHRLATDRFFRVVTGEEEAARTTLAFPEELLMSYDVIVFGKGAEYFLNAARIELLEAFVAEKGGGLLFARSKPYHGDFPEMHSLEAAEWGRPVRGDFQLRPDKDAALDGVWGSGLPPPNDEVWSKLPGLSTAFVLDRSKPFSKVHAYGHLGGESRKPVPALISRRYGNGMILTVNMEGFWHWGFFPSEANAQDIYNRFWTQLVQWTATRTAFLPGHELALNLSRDIASPGQPVRARIHHRGRAGATNLHPTLTVFREGQPVQTLTPAQSGADAARWDAVVTMDKPGAYRFVATLQEEQATRTLFVPSPPGELDEVSADPKFMAELAARSGGEAVEPKELGDLLESMQTQRNDRNPGEAEWQARWDHPVSMVLILSLLGGEWFVRRRNGLL
jgi:hypothetical protein